MQGDTTRRVVLVTGAAKRIGADIARTLHAADCDLALHYRGSAAEATAIARAAEARIRWRRLNLDIENLPD